MNKKFIKTNDGHIYKVTSNLDVFIKVSPYDYSEDRRINADILHKMVSENNAIILNKNKALEEINTLWRNTESKWVFCGKQYKTKKEHFRFINEYTFKHEYKNAYGEKYEYISRYYICFHHGKLCWVQHSHYYPQLELYKFKSINLEPSYTDFMKWTNVKNVKNVYEKNYEGKWICV